MSKQTISTLSIALLLLASAAAAQAPVDPASPPAATETPEKPDPDAPARTEPPPGPAKPDPLLPAPDVLIGPDALPAPGVLPSQPLPTPAYRAQYRSAMATVDTELPGIGHAVERAVGALKQLAFTAGSGGRATAAQHRRTLDGLTRDLANGNARLDALKRMTDRWRAGVMGTANDSASIIRGVRQRNARIAALRQRLRCGHFFARAADRALQSGEPARVNIPNGC